MAKNWTLIIDSGAGAAGVYEWMRAEEKLRGADLIVFADRFNFPYGAQDQGDLRRLVRHAVERAVYLRLPRCGERLFGAVGVLRSRGPSHHGRRGL